MVNSVVYDSGKKRPRRNLVIRCDYLFSHLKRTQSKHTQGLRRNLWYNKIQKITATMQAISGFCICHFSWWFWGLWDALFVWSIANELHTTTKWALINLQMKYCLPINRLSVVVTCNADSIACHITRLAYSMAIVAIVSSKSEWEPRFSLYLL